MITGLGTILAGFQQGLAKTGPYAYQPVLSHKFIKKIDTLIGWLFQQFDTRWASENLNLKNI